MCGWRGARPLGLERETADRVRDAGAGEGVSGEECEVRGGGRRGWEDLFVVGQGGWSPFGWCGSTAFGRGHQKRWVGFGGWVPGGGRFETGPYARGAGTGSEGFGALGAVGCQGWLGCGRVVGWLLGPGPIRQAQGRLDAGMAGEEDGRVGDGGPRWDWDGEVGSVQSGWLPGVAWECWG